jgi:hypothetical protein
MEILDLKFAGTPLWVWFGIAAAWWFGRRIHAAIRFEIEDRQRRRAEKREYEAKAPLREEQERRHAEVRAKAAEMAETLKRELDRAKT